MGRMEPRRRTRALTGLGLAVVVVLLVVSACAAGVNPQTGAVAPGATEPAGFWLGVWHGAILPVTWIVSLFTDTVTPYEVFNNGNWYDVGFVLGISIVFGGPFGASRARR